MIGFYLNLIEKRALLLRVILNTITDRELIVETLHRSVSTKANHKPNFLRKLVLLKQI